MNRHHITLDQAPSHQLLIVRGVDPKNQPSEWLHWLEDIGFIVGEHAMVLRRPMIKGGALVVRIGLSVFALHEQEAACVEVVAVS